MQARNKYRYYITDSEGVFEATPLGESEFTIEWEKNKDGWVVYEAQLQGSMTFNGGSFYRLLAHEQSESRCELLNIEVKRVCGGEIKDFFSGYISMNSGQWDLDRCTVKFSLEKDSPIKCYEEFKNTNVDLMAENENRVAVKLLGKGIYLETKECTETDTHQTRPNNAYWCEPGNPEDSGWGYYYTYQVSRFDGSVMKSKFSVRTTKWVREVIEIGCNESDPGNGWIFIDEDCTNPIPEQRHKKYARKANIIECKSSFWFEEMYNPPYHQLTECKVFGMESEDEEEEGITEITNGMHLKDVLETFLQNSCVGLIPKSDFFQINPDIESDTNYVTGKKSKVGNIILFQNSDINYPNATEKATKANFTFGKIMQALRFIFNVRWTIEDNYLRIEHVSWFSRELGLDLTSDKYRQYISGANKYSYKNSDIPGMEEWTWQEGGKDGDFKGTPILYRGGCVTSENTIKTYAIEGINTDLMLSLNKGDDSVITKDGLTMVATERNNGDYHLITEAGILTVSKANNSLATSQLLRDYHKHERPLKYGVMNNQQTEFISTLPTKQGVTLSVPLCCDEEFKPLNNVSTPLGIGTVDKATFNFKTSMLDLDLVYQSE